MVARSVRRSATGGPKSTELRPEVQPKWSLRLRPVNLRAQGAESRLHGHRKSFPDLEPGASSLISETWVMVFAVVVLSGSKRSERIEDDRRVELRDGRLVKAT